MGSGGRAALLGLGRWGCASSGPVTQEGLAVWLFWGLHRCLPPLFWSPLSSTAGEVTPVFRVSGAMSLFSGPVMFHGLFPGLDWTPRCRIFSSSFLLLARPQTLAHPPRPQPSGPVRQEQAVVTEV